MKIKVTGKTFVLLITAVFFALTIAGSSTYALPAVPETLKVGLSYGSAAANNFNLKSANGFEVGINDPGLGYVRLFAYNQPAGVTIRKDTYYNIVGGKATEIKYPSPTSIGGELIGPYHIQIGDVYPDETTARQIADRAASITPSVCLAYEGGWRVWSQLYLDEAACQAQIELMRPAISDLNLSIVYPDRKRIQILDATTGQLLYMINGDNPVAFTPAEGQSTPLMEYNKVKYRGKLLIKRMDGSDITVINEVPFTQYLYGVVPSEIPSSWHVEALKAQAVAASNYAIANVKKHSKYGFDVCATQDCQVYKGFSNETSRTNSAVNDTSGKLLLYNGSLVTAFFHSSSGGYTENNENVWGGNPIPYLRAVDDKFGLGSPYDNWVKQLSKDEIKVRLLNAKYNVGDVLDIVPLATSQYGRVTSVKIVGTSNSITLDREKIRSVLGNSDIKSIWYTLTTDADIFMKSDIASNAQKTRLSGKYIVTANGSSMLNSSGNTIYVKSADSIKQVSVTPNAYVFNGKGFGHGLGMSQYGAKGMAEAGYSYAQILEYYFTGAKVQ